jgi:galactonate dehydratase
VKGATVKITNVRTAIAGNPWKNWLFALVETDEGFTGVGEGTANYFTRTVEAAIHELRPMYIGQDPFQPALIVQRMTRDVYTDGGQIHRCAVAAIEIACLDIMGKAIGRPVADVLGGRCHGKLRAYANGWYRGPRTPEGFAERARGVVERGYTALKFDPFGAAWRVMDPADEALSVDIIAAMREAVGPHVDLLIEGHSRFSASTALRLAERMEPYHPAWFEEPVHHKDVLGTARVGHGTRIPIATGESLSSLEEVTTVLHGGGVGILQPEPLNMGGLLAARQACAMAEAHGLVIAPHQAQGPVCTAACVQLSAACPNFYLQEIFDEFNVEWEQRIATPPIRVQDGYIAIPERPGLGLTLDLEEIARHPYQQTAYLPLFRAGWERRDPNVAAETH